MQALGEELLNLSSERLESMPLEEELRDAVIMAKGLHNHHGALRRQKQLIGKLMRHADVEPIRAALALQGATGRQEKAVFREAEGWRDRIIAGGRDELATLFEELGYKSEALEDAVNACFAASHDKARREAKRRTFREIHQALARKVQSSADKR